MFLSFLMSRLTKDTFEPKGYIFYESHWIRFDLVETNFTNLRPSGNHVLRIINVFSTGITKHLPSDNHYCTWERRRAWSRARRRKPLFCFGGAGYEAITLSLSWVGGGSPKTPRTEQRRWCSYHRSQELSPATAGERCSVICYRTVAVSAAVAPVATRWASRFIASVVVIVNIHTATTDCLGDVGPVRTWHASWMKSSTSNRTPPPRACIHPGITRTRTFCEFCTSKHVQRNYVSSVRHSYPHPELL